MRKKSFLILILIIVFCICISGCSSNVLSNATTSPTITTESTTLSEEEILANRLEDIKESVSAALKEDYGVLDITYLSGYVNFQDYISGAKSNPNDYFFFGTSMGSMASLYSNTKYYTNSDALKWIEESNVSDADYLFCCMPEKKDAYGKKDTRLSYVLVRENDQGTHFWFFDDFDGTNLGYMIMAAIMDKCEIIY